MSRLCLPLTGSSLEEDLRTASKHRTHIDSVELRADFLSREDLGKAGAFPRLVDLPAILTLRRQRDGGNWTGSERDRVAMLGRLAGSGFAFVELEEDLEDSGPDLAARSGGARIIRSCHDSSGVPADLPQRMRRLSRAEDEIPKAVVVARGVADLVLLLSAFRALRGTEMILAATGDFGFPATVLAGKLGSALGYCSASDSAAAGQGDPSVLDTVYRFHAIRESTEVYGVIGNPVMHSLSPVIHNLGFASLGLDAVYVPFPVDALARFWEVADTLGVRGLSVTVPFKEEVLARLASGDALVESMRACNTMVRDRSGEWRGANTDREGFLAPLREAFGGRIPSGLKATVVGAGGAARAVVHALAGQGARVLVVNRTIGRARELSRLFGVPCAGLDPEGYLRMREHSDLIVQATSAGMDRADKADPVPGYDFSGAEVVFELIYAPPLTPFLARAKAAGCRLVYGMQMLLAQAFEQFRMFTGRPFPPEAASRLGPLLGREYFHD